LKDRNLATTGRLNPGCSVPQGLPVQAAGAAPLPNSATLLHGPLAQAGQKHGASSGMGHMKSCKYHSVAVAWVGKAAKGGKLTWLLLMPLIGIYLG